MTEPPLSTDDLKELLGDDFDPNTYKPQNQHQPPSSESNSASKQTPYFTKDPRNGPSTSSTSSTSHEAWDDSMYKCYPGYNNYNVYNNSYGQFNTNTNFESNNYNIPYESNNYTRNFEQNNYNMHYPQSQGISQMQMMQSAWDNVQNTSPWPSSFYDFQKPTEEQHDFRRQQQQFLSPNQDQTNVCFPAEDREVNMKSNNHQSSPSHPRLKFINKEHFRGPESNKRFQNVR